MGSNVVVEQNAVAFSSKIPKIHGYQTKLILHSVIVVLMVIAVFIREIYLQHVQYKGSR